MASISLRYSDRQVDLKTYTASRSYDLVNATSELDALNTVLAVAPIGSAHPFFTSLKAEPPRITSWSGPRCCIVEQSYSIPAGSSPGTDPLLQPARVRMEKVDFESQVDRDTDKNPILNSAFDPFEPPPQRREGYRRYVITRWEAQYAIDRADDEYSVNSNTVDIFGFVSAEPGTLLFVSYVLLDEVTRGATPVRVQYTFDHDPVGMHKWRLEDLGYRGFAGDNVKAAILDSKKQQLAVAARLSNGIPIDPNFVIAPNLTPASPSTTPAGSEREESKDASGKLLGVFLKYKKYPSIDFGTLGLF